MIQEKPWLDQPVEGPFLRVGEACDYLGVSRTQFYVSAADGRFPRPVKMTAQSAGLPKSWLDAVIRARVAESLGVIQ